MLVKPQDVRQSLFIMTLYTMLRITYFKTFHVVKYHCINVVKMIFCLLGNSFNIKILYQFFEFYITQAILEPMC